MHLDKTLKLDFFLKKEKDASTQKWQFTNMLRVTITSWTVTTLYVFCFVLGFFFLHKSWPVMVLFIFVLHHRNCYQISCHLIFAGLILSEAWNGKI